jgi:hypothetical protein
VKLGVRLPCVDGLLAMKFVEFTTRSVCCRERGSSNARLAGRTPNR